MNVKSFHSPLVNAAKRGEHDDVETLSEAYVKLRTKQREFYPALYIAAYQGHEKIVRILLSKGADPNYCLENYLPILHAAAQKGRMKIAQLLLDHGAKVNPKLKIQSGSKSKKFREVDYFSTPLLTAARGGHYLMVRLLIMRGADIEARLRSTSVTVSEDIERIFAFGDYRDSDISSNSSKLGYTSLHFAVESGEKVVVNALLDRGIDVNSKSDNGITPLLIAVKKEEKSIAKILFEANPNQQIEKTGIPLLQEILRETLCSKGTSPKLENSIDSNNKEDSQELVENEKGTGK